MEFADLFNGNALSMVDGKGRLSVPAFIRSVVERRSDAKAIIVGTQEASPCLNAYDRSYAQYLFRENERRRLAEEAGGGEVAAAEQRARRTFGLTEEALYDPSGRIVLPPMLRRKGNIEDMALFVGVGGTFEIWNPRLALDSGDSDLAEIAAFRLEEKGIAP